MLNGLEDAKRMAMTGAARREAGGAVWVTALTNANADLASLAQSSEREIATVMQAFNNLAGQTEKILKQAAAIVNSVSDESVTSVSVHVRSLSVTVQQFLKERLEAATTILQTLQQEERLLRQLTWVTHCQEAVAGHLRALSVLTNVEVAQLGCVGSGFQFLARELYAFAKSVTEQTLELARHAESRKRALEETRRDLAASLPELRMELDRMESDLGERLQIIEDGLGKLGSIPGQFQNCAEAISKQITGIVVAIQSQDITRQQLEHVQEALGLISSTISNPENGQAEGLPTIFAGLTIQECQLKNIKATVSTWVAQVGACMQAIQDLSASDVVKIGEIVLAQERELSSQFLHIEQLQQRSQAYGAKIQDTVHGLLSLVELVNDHIGRSQNIRHRLQMLTFNSLIEAHHLGHQGTVVSSIANLIKGVSTEWSGITDQSRTVLSEISNLVDQTNKVMEAFSDASCDKLREDQAHSGESLDAVRRVAVFVGREAGEMQVVTAEMRANVSSVRNAGGLESCFKPLDTALERIEAVSRSLKGKDDTQRMLGQCNQEEIEQLFAASYTTEIERDVLRAALRGAPLPVLQQSVAGNAVELF
jgi:hypothetical protein